MSLRKSTALTPRRVDAARHNAGRSTGPRSPAGKERMKLNALKHGLEAAAENEAAVMRALGEDPERFASLRQELAASYGAGEALGERQIDDLARLYWRRERLERMQTGLMRQALEAVEARGRVRREEIAAVTFPPSRIEAPNLDMGEPTDRCARLRLQLSLLEVVRGQVLKGHYPEGQQKVIGKYQDKTMGWRPARLRQLQWRFGEWTYYKQKGEPEALKKCVQQTMGGEANMNLLWQELVRLLEEEIAALKVRFAEAVKAEEEKEAAERDACLAPEGKTWETLARQEMALDRSIDRKVRILLSLRKEQTSRRNPESPTAAPDPDACDAHEAPAPPPKPSERVRQAEVRADVAPTSRSAGAGLKAGATTESAGLKASATTESQNEESPLETPKSPEQSENVIENKDSAVAKVRQ